MPDTVIFMISNARYGYSFKCIETPDKDILSKPEVLIKSCCLSCLTDVFTFQYYRWSDCMISHIIYLEC